MITLIRTFLMVCVSLCYAGEDNLAEVKRRLEALENSQEPTVDSALEQLQVFIRAPSFSRERALDNLISLKIVAKEASHQKSGFYSAVLRAMQEKNPCLQLSVQALSTSFVG